MVEDAISFWTDIQRYEDMLAADPNSYCFAPLSELYRKLGLLDDAISVAQKGCALHPDYPGGFFALGNACHAKGLADQARQALERTVSLNPDNLQALKLLGQLYVEEGELSRARKVLQRVLQQNPDDLESSLLLDSLGSQVAVPQPEEELLEEVEVIEELTELLDEEEELTGAFEEAEEPEGWPEGPAFEPAEEPAAQQPRRDPLSTATLAELYVTQGHLGKALGIYQQLLSDDPGNQAYRTRCAQIRELQLRQAQQTAVAVQSAAPAVQPPPEPAAARQAAPVEGEAQARQESAPGPAFEPAFQPGGGQAANGAGALPPEQAAAHFDLDAALEQSASPQSGAQGREQSSSPPGDLEAELCSWLENIRRRKDGV